MKSGKLRGHTGRGWSSLAGGLLIFWGVEFAGEWGVGPEVEGGDTAVTAASMDEWS